MNKNIFLIKMEKIIQTNKEELLAILAAVVFFGSLIFAYGLKKVLYAIVLIIGTTVVVISGIYLFFWLEIKLSDEIE